MKNPISMLRKAGHAEAISFLVLVGIAMPLKYLAHQPLAVRVVGMAHGILFLWYCAALLRAKLAARWGLGRSAWLFAAAFFPGGPFFFEGRLKEWEAEYVAGAVR